MATAIALEALVADALRRGEECKLTEKLAWTLGLSATVGRLAMATVHPSSYDEVLSESARVPTSILLDLERERFDITHLEVSAGLLDEWGVPRCLSEAVMQHQARQAGTEVEQCALEGQLLTAARELAKTLVRSGADIENSWQAGFPAIDRAAFELGLEPQQVVLIAPRIRRKWREWNSVLRAPETTDARRLPLDESTVFLPEEDARTSTRVLLLVDDDHRAMRIMEYALKREGYEVYTAESCEAALRLSLELLPHVLITDWMMPGMSGVELCRTLRRTEFGRRMYVLFVTARNDDTQALTAFRSGADDYIGKPFNPQILSARVRAGKRLILTRERVQQSERERLRQLAEMGVLTRRLREAALTDPLTGLPNRRHAMEHLKQEWERSVRDGRELAVIALDLDHFKHVNDEYGHDAGDLVLRQTAEVMRGVARGGETLCRMGGEEFLSIHQGCSLEQAWALAERLRAAGRGRRSSSTPRATSA